jgi:hypothetical protein
MISKPQQCGRLAPGRAVSPKEEKILIISAKWQDRFHKHDTNGGSLCWLYGASPRDEDAFARNYIYFYFGTRPPDCTVPRLWTSWYEVCNVKISHVIHFHGHFSDVLSSVDFQCVVSEK